MYHSELDHSQDLADLTDDNIEVAQLENKNVESHDADYQNMPPGIIIVLS